MLSWVQVPPNFCRVRRYLQQHKEALTSGSRRGSGFSLAGLVFRDVMQLSVNKSVLFSNIKALCDKEGITIYQLEKKVGLSQHTIENSHTKAVAWERIYAVSKYFDVSMDYLIGNTNNPYSHKYPLDQTTKEIVEAAERLQLSEQDSKIIVQMMEVLKKVHS